MVQYRDPGSVVFDAVIENPGGPGAYVTFPFDTVEVFGVRARVPVKARFDDRVAYTGSLAPYGGQHRLGVRKDIQQSLGKTHGDTVRVELVLDTERADVAGDDKSGRT
ncbi:DUF1905 domain-containing protein [Mycobacterium sp. 663a-19]|uniref:DUF1905 domain-containing protein n=1 Tax=Mycobacterium sp. 663a-19 TaxID=2986148 RepID=UPI002D1F8CF6|nr:DUF1905 domain-containing protein [Mycobacterium sp. 663a-19]MEB3981506.1 DUF1905 domain-containing protein [Mycobacterium sp. 663a-19]